MEIAPILEKRTLVYELKIDTSELLIRAKEIKQ